VKKFLILFALLGTGPIYGQDAPVDTAGANLKESLTDISWLLDLSEKGLEITGDSLVISGEFMKLLHDEHYRTEIYPEQYTWEAAMQSMISRDLKKTFWFFINLYPESQENKELVVRSVMAYEKLLSMEKVLINTFNTYCYADPEVSVIVDGVPEIVHPDVLEAKLRDVQEIVGYIKYFREQQKD
jgi:hypothetical protein